MRSTLIALLAGAASFTFPSDMHAADHFDGSKTGGDPSSDIADFYLYPVQNGTKVVLILNVNPRAGKTAFFSDVIDYGFRIRSGRLEATNGGVQNSVGEKEFIISCKFDIDDASASDLAMTANCALNKGDSNPTKATVSVDSMSGGSNPAMKVFAGLRADPFFTDAGRIRLPRPRYRSLKGFVSTGNAMRPDLLALGVRAGGPDSTQGNLPNVLSIVIELDAAELAPLGTKLAVVAETNRRAN